MRTKVRMSSVLVVISLMSIASPGEAASSRIPLRMAGSATESLTPDAGCRGFHNTVKGKLSGTPLGAATWSSTECIDFLEEPGVGTVRGGRFTMKSRYGSIVGTYATKASAPSSAGRVYASGKFKVKSGTGRYRTATGDGILMTRSDISAGTARYELVGWLS